jgi:hypothetical protein
MRAVRNFEAGLSSIEKVIEFIESPFLAALKASLPAQGMNTKPAKAEPAALLAVGAATVVFGSDRAADRELAYHWDALLPHFESACLRVPADPLRSQHFRDYRDRVMGGQLPDAFKELTRELFAQFALELGLFPRVASPWTAPQLNQSVYADGTKFAAASQVTGVKNSRAQLHPRVVTDADEWTHGRGYTFCLLVARDPRPHRRVILDIVHAPNSSEMDVVVPAAIALRHRLGTGFRAFIYDGAMRGTHHVALRRAGLVTVNKPRGIRRIDQWRTFQDSRLGKAAKVFELDTGCERRHLLTLAAGMAWDVEPGVGQDLHRRRVLELGDLRRLPATSGEYRWEADLIIRCPHGDHVVTIDPNETISATTVRALRTQPDGSTGTRQATANFSEDLRLVQVNDEDLFAPLYGLRNDSESGNNHLKFTYRLNRSRSYTVGRHDTDLWLYALMANTLVWREHCTITGRRPLTAQR